MEFQFGTNWAPFSEAVGNFFGTLLFFAALYFGSRIIRRLPKLDLPVPGEEKPAVDTTPGKFIPDQRPVEAK